jgi:putative N-acetylmannosamine-6-phosphate epimerase
VELKEDALPPSTQESTAAAASSPAETIKTNRRGVEFVGETVQGNRKEQRLGFWDGKLGGKERTLLDL